MYGFIQDLPITPEIYARIREGLGTEPPEGLIVHVVTRHDDGLRYTDVWESRELCDRFLAERVHPVLQRAFAAHGGVPQNEPPRRDVEIVDVWQRLPEGVAPAR
jgi:hypothetical protein